MPEVRITTRPNGPFLVEGPFTLIDSEGKEYQLDAEKPAYALCRCGQSGNQPFCDGAHKSCGFDSTVEAP